MRYVDVLVSIGGELVWWSFAARDGRLSEAAVRRASERFGVHRRAAMRSK
jgi:hypothetical protein